MKKHNPSTSGSRGIATRTALKAANAESDDCYATRNYENFRNGCGIGGVCYLEQDLMTCLSRSGEKNWWMDFPEMNQNKACRTTINAANEVAKKIVDRMGC
jgi:hypothetical protein